MYIQSLFFKKIIFFILFLGLPFAAAYGQTMLDINNPSDDETDFSPERLIKEVLITGACADIPSVTASVFGDETNNATKSYGYFKRPTGSAFPFEKGIILTSGSAYNAGNSFIGIDLSTNAEPTTDGDIDNVLEDLINAYNTSVGIANVTLSNANAIEFEFTPTSNTISFRYIMASEEYQSSYPCSYADAFGFLLKVKNSADDYVNLAVVPGTATPVAVTTVHNDIDTNGDGDTSDIGECSSINEEYYAGTDDEINFEGRTKVLTATATVIPGTIYTIRLVIADAGTGGPDSGFDSAVFLEAGSFNLGLDLGEDLTTISSTAVCDTEKLLEASVTADSYQWFKDDVAIAGATNQTYLANLGNGVYKCEISNAGCANGSDEITIEFLNSPINNTNVNSLKICDINGDLKEIIDLTVKNNEIIKNIDPSIHDEFQVVFFKDNAYTNKIENPNTYENTNLEEIIYAQIQNKFQTSCSVNTSFQLSVTGLPIPTQPTDYNLCDDATDGDDTNNEVAGFDLSTKNNEILGTLDAAQYLVIYYEDETDAENKINPINTTTFQNEIITNTQTVYARVENTDNEDCYAIVPLQLVVNPLPVLINNPVTIDQCIKTDQEATTINLTTAQNIISQDYENETFAYYEDAAGTNLITNPTNYSVLKNIPKTVYVKAITAFECSRELVTLNINVAETNDNAYADLQPPVCDDFLDADGANTDANSDTDNITQFSLDATTIINGINPPINTTIFFYENADDRANSLNEIDITNYRNNINKIDITPITNGIQFPIYYKLVSTINNNCQGLGQFYLQINAVPTADTNNDIEDLSLCDINQNGIRTFNLSNQTATLLEGQNPDNYTVTYYDSQENANLGTPDTQLPTLYTNTTLYNQIIYTRVTNTTTGCFNAHVNFNLQIDPLPVANFISAPVEVCPALDGFVQPIALNVNDAEVLDTQDPLQFLVSYHNSEDDATNGIDPILSYPSIPIRPTTLITKTIYVRVYNQTTGCANGVSSFEIIIHPAPNVLLTDISNLSLCDDATDGDDTNGIVQNFDLTTQTNSILNNYDASLHDDFTITYHRSQAHAETGGSPITDSEASQYQNTPQLNGNPERIYIRVTNKDTGCVSADTYFDLLVNPLPNFEVTTPQIVCLNDTPLTITAENPIASYSYQWTNVSDGFVIGNNQDLEIFEAGTYKVTATDITTGCNRFYEITVNASNPAVFDLEAITIVDDSNNNTITINNSNLGIGDYEYALTNEKGDFVVNYQDEPFFENLEGGIYNILIRDKNGCDITDVPSLAVPIIEYPKFFTPNNDGVNDTWFIKGANASFFPTSEIYIFNRYGKVVAQIKLNEPGWDGTYNGKKLPSNDYWFSIKLQGQTVGNRERKGHFSLIRR